MGKTTVQFNSYLQMRTLARKIPVMNNYEFVMAEYEYQMIRKGSDEGFIKISATMMILIYTNTRTLLIGRMKF